jgi:hypothetical protein
MMNTWNTVLESYQLRVYNNTAATVEYQMQQVENQMADVVISKDAVSIYNNFHVHELTSEVVLMVLAIRITAPNILIANNSTDDKPHFGMQSGSGNYENSGDESYAITPVSWQLWPTTELQRIDMGTRDVDGYDGVAADDVDVKEEEGASQHDDGG